MRRAAFVIALALSWLFLLMWVAVDWRAPLAPASERSFPGSRFHAVFGTAVPHQQRLHVESAAEDHSVLQSTALPELRAADFTVLRYRFADFPRTLELSLLFRTAQNPEDVQTVTLPWPGQGTSTFDLSQVEAWQGEIIELGFAQFATPQLVPAERGFAPFDLVSVDLWSPSWRGDLAALATDWFGAWPWSQRSVHALGREGDAPRAHSAIVFVAIAIAITIGWAALLFGLRGRRLAVVAIGCAMLGWFALDLRWQVGLVQRLLATRELYAGSEWPERARIVGDSELLAAADRIKTLLRDEPENARILVQSDSGYSVLRLSWHLLPRNVGAFWHARPLGLALPEGTLIVFHASDAWYRDPATRKLLAHSQRLHAAGSMFADGFDEPDSVVFRYHYAR